MRHIFLVLLAFASVATAEAHVGNENNTEIRIFSDTMRVVLRTSIPFAWNMLGQAAPAMADEAGQAIAKPLLVAAAPGLFRVTAGGKPLSPKQVDCVFEVEKDVAFILTFARPTEWPVAVEAEFFDRFSSLDTGTITVFDYTASRFSRDLEPIAKKTIDARSPSVTFSLAAVATTAAAPAPEVVPSPPVPAAAAPPTEPGVSKKWIAIPLLLAAVGVVGILAFRRLREES